VNFDLGLSSSPNPEIMGAKGKAGQPVPQASFVCEGEYWTLGFEDRLVRLKDSRGLRLIAGLVREPGREFHVLNLGPRKDPGELDSRASRLDPEELARLTVRSTMSDGDGELIDAQARAKYQRRAFELTEELEEAREFPHDQERIARIEEEIDQVERELKAAFGLSGRSRKAGSTAEQARVNITKNIGRALDQIEAKHENLGHFLKSTIKTGIFCSYQPDPRFRLPGALKRSGGPLTRFHPQSSISKSKAAPPICLTGHPRRINSKASGSNPQVRASRGELSSAAPRR